MIKFRETYIWTFVIASIFISFSILSKKHTISNSTQELKDRLTCSSGIKHAFFTPKDNVRQIIIDLIKNEKKSIKVTIYMLTDKYISEALIQAKKENNINIEIICCYSNKENNNSKICYLEENGITIYTFKKKTKTGKKNKRYGDYAGIMHNKFFIFEQNIDDKSILLTGSFNPTNRAQAENRENILVLEDKYLIERYKEEFENIKKDCKLTIEDSAKAIDSSSQIEVPNMTWAEKFKRSFRILTS